MTCCTVYLHAYGGKYIQQLLEGKVLLMTFVLKFTTQGHGKYFGIFVVTLSVVTLLANFGVILSGPNLIHYREILLHCHIVVTLSVNLELHYRLMLHYRFLLHYRA